MPYLAKDALPSHPETADLVTGTSNAPVAAEVCAGILTLSVTLFGGGAFGG